MGHGQIQQGVRGSAVPPEYSGVAIGPCRRREQREVGDAPQVEHPSPPSDRRQQSRISGGHQRRSLAAQGKIGSAEIEHHRSLQQLGQQRSLQQLPAAAAAMVFGRSMPEGLTVAAHQFSAAIGVAGVRRLGLDFGERLAHLQHIGRANGLPLASADQTVA